MIAVSTLKSIIWGMNEKNEDILAKNRTILLKHANNVCGWINNWTVGDVYKSNKKREVPPELQNFDEFADATMKEVTIVFEKMKENKLFLGNKGFSRNTNLSKSLNFGKKTLTDTKDNLP